MSGTISLLEHACCVWRARDGGRADGRRVFVATCRVTPRSPSNATCARRSPSAGETESRTTWETISSWAAFGSRLTLTTRRRKTSGMSWLEGRAGSRSVLRSSPALYVIHSLSTNCAWVVDASLLPGSIAHHRRLRAHYGHRQGQLREGTSRSSCVLFVPHAGRCRSCKFASATHLVSTP